MCELFGIDKTLMFKAFTTKLSTRRRHELKNHVFLAACDIFKRAGYIFSMSRTDPIDDDIVVEMELFETWYMVEFLKHCRMTASTKNEKRYVKYVVRKKILPIINQSFDYHVERLNKIDTLNILNNYNQYPRFMITALIQNFKVRRRGIETQIKTQII